MRSRQLRDVSTARRPRRVVVGKTTAHLRPIPIDERIADAWARLRIAMRDSWQRMPVCDSWIAASALALDVPVLLTQDADCVDIPGLRAIHV